jgi:predicted phage terminase large subunit-like protein
MGFAGQYLQTPGGEGGVLIKGNWYGRYMIGELPENVVWDFAIDGAYTKDKINNASVLMAYTKYQNDMYIRAVASVWKEFPDFVRFIKDFCFRNGYTRYSRIYIEPRASGIPAAQILKRHTNLNIIIDKAPTTDKVTRTTACLPFLEARRCNLLADEPWIDSFIYETTMFPNAKEDGQVDCLCIAVDKVSVRRGGGKIKIRTMNVYERYNC